MTDAPWWTIIAANLPQAVRGTKRRLLRWPARGRRIRQLLSRSKVTLGGLQEVGPKTARAFGLGRFALFLADPNVKRGAWEVMNGALADRGRMERLHRRQLRIIRKPARGRAPILSIPFVLHRDRATGDRVILMAGHADRKKPDPRWNIGVLTAIARAGADLHHATACPIVCAIDTNRADPAIFEHFGWVELAGFGGIDKVFGIGLRGRNPRTLPGFHGEVTDHHNPPAVDVTPVVRNFTLRRLPRLSSKRS